MYGTKTYCKFQFKRLRGISFNSYLEGQQLPACFGTLNGCGKVSYINRNTCSPLSFLHTHTPACWKDTDDHRNRHGNPPHFCILLHDLFDATLSGGKHSLQIKKIWRTSSSKTNTLKQNVFILSWQLTVCVVNRFNRRFFSLTCSFVTCIYSFMLKVCLQNIQNLIHKARQ